jgi:hypothetical protein
MATLLFAPEADLFLSELEVAPTRIRLLGEINTALDLLEQDPSDVRCRRRRFSNIGCWAISLEAERTEWLILWEEAQDGSVIVRAIVPAP